MEYEIWTYPNFVALFYELSNSVYDIDSYLNNHKGTLEEIKKWFAHSTFGQVDVELKFTKGIVNLVFVFDKNEKTFSYSILEDKMKDWFPSAKLMYRECEETGTVYLYTDMGNME